jgi:hypothetical protein
VLADLLRPIWTSKPETALRVRQAIIRVLRFSRPDGQLKVMTAMENCRTAALGGHVGACDDCGHWRIAYNSCRNRHCLSAGAPPHVCK